MTGKDHLLADLRCRRPAREGSLPFRSCSHYHWGFAVTQWEVGPPGPAQRGLKSPQPQLTRPCCLRGETHPGHVISPGGHSWWLCDPDLLLGVATHPSPSGKNLRVPGEVRMVGPDSCCPRGRRQQVCRALESEEQRLGPGSTGKRRRPTGAPTEVLRPQLGGQGGMA